MFSSFLLFFLQVYIYLDDINDNPPRFTKSDHFVNITETYPVGTQVLQVFATDADIGFNAEIAYRISNNSGDPNGIVHLYLVVVSLY